MDPKIISHYRIIEKIGSGGMGVVYKAEDLKLKRIVSIKFLPLSLSLDEESKERFIHEAQTASSFKHHNICTIHEIDETPDGQLFIVMDYYTGDTLKKKLSSGALLLRESIEIINQIGNGLSKAHSNGIIHRDIKPENIIFDDGVVKILDFGLAKLANQLSGTKQSVTKGTLTYMSPEQISGKEVDCRTDIWALSVLFYEMLTGRLPFEGTYEPEIFYSILNENPISINNFRNDVPEHLNNAIIKGLEKKPDDRFQSVDDFLSAVNGSVEYETNKKKGSKIIKWLPRAFAIIIFSFLIYFILKTYVIDKSVQKKYSSSVAVLPFVNIDSTGKEDFFADGLTEEIINSLANINQLKVIARTSSFKFRGVNEDIRKIGEQLNVENILEGSIRKSGNRVRIVAQLINAKEGSHIWSQKYDCAYGETFSVQDQICKSIVDELLVRLAVSNIRLARNYTTDTETYLLYLKGRYFWNKKTKQNLEKAIEYFKKTIERDSSYALAYSGIADSYNILAYGSTMSSEEAFTNSIRYAHKAIQKDSLLSEAWTSLAFAYERYYWDFKKAEQYYRKAIDVNHSYAIAYQWYGLSLVLHERYDEGLEMFRNALRIDPLSLQINADYGMALYQSHKFDDAVMHLNKVVEMDSTFPWTRNNLGLVYEAQKKYNLACREYFQIGKVGRLKQGILDPREEAYKKAGWQGYVKYLLDASLKLFNKGSNTACFGITANYIRLGNYNEALRWLEIMYETKNQNFIIVKTSPLFDPIKNYPKYHEIMKKAGFE